MLVQLFIFIILVALSSCQHATKSENSDFKKITNSEKNIILANCEFFNLEGVAIRKYAGGEFCVPYDNGDLVITRNAKLEKLDKGNKVLWSYPEFAHHQMKKSSINNDIILLSAFFTEADGRPLRHDTIKVIDDGGNLKKMFDFSKIFIEKEQKRIKSLRDWNKNWYKKPFYEYTHINSISEIVDTATNGSKQLKGYIVNDRATRKIFIFDAGLKTVVNVFDPFRDEPKHDVSFLNKDTIIYYANHNHKNPKKSYVVSYNFITAEKKIIHGASSLDFFSPNNGGVQYISKDLFLISHSPEEGNSYVEFTTEDGKVLKKIVLNGSRKLIQEAKLNDYSDFLKHNVGN